MKDIQNQPDHRRISIKKVGVKNISYPIKLRDKARKEQRTVALVNMYVYLPHHFKGTHMSRFIEILNHFHGEINLQSFRRVLENMKERLQAPVAHMEVAFPYYLKKNTTATNRVGIEQYQCTMHGSLEEDEDDLTLTIQVPIYPPHPEQVNRGLPMSLGHWGIADVSLRFRHFIWIEDLIQMVEEVTSHNLSCSADSPLPQDTALTVEQITSALGETLSGHPDIESFALTVKNLSQGYSTFASLDWSETPAAN